MEESILTSIKKLLGISEDCTDFDVDLIIHINSVFMVLNQLGVGKSSGFTIQDNEATWEEYIKTKENLEAVKSYMYMKVRLLFDPPQSTAAIENYNKLISEFEWRINVSAEKGAQ